MREGSYPKYLEDIGHLLLSSPPPWVGKQKFYVVSLFRWWADRDQIRFQNSKEPLKLGSNATFGVFALFAVMLESIQNQKRFGDVIERIRMTQLVFFNKYMRLIFISRFEQAEDVNLQGEMDQCSFDSEQQAFIWRWIRKEVNLTGRKRKK